MNTIIANLHGHGVKFYSVDESEIHEADDGSWIVYAEEVLAPKATVKPFFDMTTKPIGGAHLRAGSRAKLAKKIRTGELECAKALGGA